MAVIKHVVREHGARAWCGSMVRECDGTRAWCESMVRECGARVWCESVVRECGARVRCESVVREYGAREWCERVVRECGARARYLPDTNQQVGRALQFSSQGRSKAGTAKRFHQAPSRCPRSTGRNYRRGKGEIDRRAQEVLTQLRARDGL
jgi:hypothetical protein